MPYPLRVLGPAAVLARGVGDPENAAHVPIDRFACATTAIESGGLSPDPFGGLVQPC